MSEVIGIKLSNGFEVIAKYEGDNAEGELILKDAFFIQAVGHDDGGVGFQYMPITYMGKMAGKSHSGFDFNLPKAGILFKFELNDDIVVDYRQKTSLIDLSATAMASL